MPDTLAAIGKECIDAVAELQMTMMNKEKYLAHHIRRLITMCMQAMTKSPVESMNKITKHGQHSVNSNMNLSNTVPTMLKGTMGGY